VYDARGYILTNAHVVAAAAPAGGPQLHPFDGEPASRDLGSSPDRVSNSSSSVSNSSPDRVSNSSSSVSNSSPDRVSNSSSSVSNSSSSVSNSSSSVNSHGSRSRQESGSWLSRRGRSGRDGDTGVGGRGGRGEERDLAAELMVTLQDGRMMKGRVVCLDRCVCVSVCV